MATSQLSQLYEWRKDSQPKSAEIDNKSETQDFKVTLLKNDTEWSDLFEKIEVRRFVVSKDRITSLVYIKEKIRTLFVNQIENGVNLKIHWRDKDGNFIRVRSDEELLISQKYVQFLSALFKILVNLPVTWYSEKMTISTRCMCGLIPNSHRKFWIVSK